MQAKTATGEREEREVEVRFLARRLHFVEHQERDDDREPERQQREQDDEELSHTPSLVDRRTRRPPSSR
jgi:hypothetical protein